MNTPVTDPHLDLLDEARRAAAVADRSQRRLLADADDQDASFVGSLEDLAEAGARVVLDTVVGRRVPGAVRALSGDHVLLDGDKGRVWVRLDAVTAVRPQRGGPVRAGGADREQRAAVPFAEALRTLAEDRATVEVVFAGGVVHRGTALAVGRDVLTLRDPATADRVLVHLTPAAVVAEQHDH